MVVKALVTYPIFVEIEIEEDISPSEIMETVKDHAYITACESDVWSRSCGIVTEIEVVENEM